MRIPFDVPTLLGREREYIEEVLELKRISGNGKFTGLCQDHLGRLIEICTARGAASYVSGPSGRAYIEEQAFADAGIEIRYADYSDYPVYSQHADVFEHGVSILDVLFHCGETTRTHLKSVTQRETFLQGSHQAMNG